MGTYEVPCEANPVDGSMTFGAVRVVSDSSPYCNQTDFDAEHQFQNAIDLDDRHWEALNKTMAFSVADCTGELSLFDEMGYLQVSFGML